MCEIWKPIAGWEGGYEVSNHGNVRSVDRWVKSSKGRQRRCVGKVLKPTHNNRGYLYVKLSRNNQLRFRYIHHLVGDAFVSQALGLEFDHKDQDKSNNTSTNLRLATRSQNRANGKKLKGSSRYKGVYQDKRAIIESWVANISVKNTTIYLGVFRIQEEAAIAYNDAATKYFGDFARLNIIHRPEGTPICQS